MVKRAKVQAGLGNIGRSGARGAKHALFLYAAQKVSPDFLGKYQGAADKILASVMERAAGRFKSGGSALFEVGIAEAGANLLTDFVEPFIARNFAPKLQKTNGGVSLSLANPLAARA